MRAECVGPQNGRSIAIGNGYRECMRQCVEQILLEHCFPVRSITFRRLSLIFQGQFDRTTDTHTRGHRIVSLSLPLVCFGLFSLLLASLWHCSSRCIVRAILCEPKLTNRLPYYSISFARTAWSPMRSSLHPEHSQTLICISRTFLCTRDVPTNPLYVNILLFHVCSTKKPPLPSEWAKRATPNMKTKAMQRQNSLSLYRRPNETWNKGSQRLNTEKRKRKKGERISFVCMGVRARARTQLCVYALLFLC